ncbi:MAG TPA: ATP-binding protein [Verrucomicrobiae bacterium]|nr:ATP-binding protein [Verrucomicrobiae bacterium]
MTQSRPDPDLDAVEADDEDDSDSLSLHHGEALMHFANTYPTLNLTIVEAVQNAIDAKAHNVFIGINPNPQGREVLVLDDGNGVTQDDFRRALMSVGKSVKRKGSLGRFGRGLISPLDKCKTYVFASMSSGMDHANIWTFRGEDIIKQARDIKVPIVQEAKLPRVPRRFSKQAAALGCRWRTMVNLREVTEDKVVNATNIDDLQGLIRAKLGIGMRRSDTTVHILINDGLGHPQSGTINPDDFQGQPLEVVRFDGGECGEVVFELYRARKSGGKRSGEVFVMELDDDYPVTLREVQTQAMGARWLDAVKDAFDVLGSGYFEGTIRVEKIELAPERNKFVLNEALMAMYLAIDWWYQHHGKEYFEDESEAQRDERYRELGEKSLARLLGELDEGITRKLADLFPAEVEAEQALERKARGPSPTGDNTSSKRTRRQPTIARPPKPEREEQDEQGQTKGTSSKGSLKFAYEMMEGSSYLWIFDPDTGVLTFNIRHPVWVKLDETQGKHNTRHDRQIMHLQEWLALKLVLLLIRHGSFDFEFDVERVAIDLEAPHYAKHFIAGKR